MGGNVSGRVEFNSFSGSVDSDLPISMRSNSRRNVGGDIGRHRRHAQVQDLQWGPTDSEVLNSGQRTTDNGTISTTRGDVCSLRAFSFASLRKGPCPGWAVGASGRGDPLLRASQARR